MLEDKSILQVHDFVKLIIALLYPTGRFLCRTRTEEGEVLYEVSSSKSYDI